MAKIGLRLAAVSGLAFATMAHAQAGQPGDAKATERAFDAQISEQDQLNWLKTMSSAPNHVGSPHDKANAEFMLAKFKEWGWDAKIETFSVLYPTPISTTVELVTPEHIVLGLQGRARWPG